MTAKRDPRLKLRVPADLMNALNGNGAAAITFKDFAPDHGCDYVEWLVETNRPETQGKRLA